MPVCGTDLFMAGINQIGGISLNSSFGLESIIMLFALSH